MTAICLTVNVSEGGSLPSDESVFEITDFSVTSPSIVAGKEVLVRVDVRNTSDSNGEAIIRFRQGSTGVVLGVTDPVDVPAHTTMRVEIAFILPAAVAAGPLQLCTTAMDVETTAVSNALCVGVNVEGGSGGFNAASIPWWALAAAGLAVVGIVVTRK